MSTWTEDVRFLRGLGRNTVLPALQQSVNQNHKKLEEEQKVQLWTGEKADGLPIKPDYAPATIKHKQRTGKPYDRVTMNQTGRMYRNLKVASSKEDVIIDLGVDYGRYLIGKYKKDTFGWQTKFLDNFFRVDVKPILNKKIDEQFSKYSK